jgi:hypothetical protein
VKKEIVLFAGERTELEIIMLIEVNQVHRDKGLMFSLIYGRAKR